MPVNKIEPVHPKQACRQEVQLVASRYEGLAGEAAYNCLHVYLAEALHEGQI